MPHNALSVTYSGPESGPGLVLLHGWGSRGSLMESLARPLSDTFRVANVDLPGHGAAPVPPAAMDMEDHAQAVDEVIRSMPDGRAAILGHSNGGRIALYMASDPRYRDRIDRLVLVSPSGVRRPRTLGYHVRRTVATTLKAPFRLLPGRLREAGLDWLRHSLVWRLLGSSDYRSLDGTLRDTFVQLVNTYVEERLADVRVPVLVFWGDRDDAVLRQQVDRIVEKVPDAGLFVLEGAGHYGFLDRPDEVRAGTRTFLTAP